ncbi:MAG: hypothetical protein KAU94_03005 [Verrucomicrobia bacterium]|nr:hypothetical protein [Verrucomicrobiota bacterium]
MLSYLYSRGLRGNTPAATSFSFDFDDGTMQEWTNTLTGGAVATNPTHFAAQTDQGKGGGHTPDYSLLHDGGGSWLDGRDVAHDTLVASSPPFVLSKSKVYSLSFYLLGGTGNTNAAPESLSTLSATTSESGFMGVALRRVSDGVYLLRDHRDTTAQYTAWEQQGWLPTEIAAATAGDALDETYQLDFIDQFHGGWGWTILDTVVLSEIREANWIGGDAAWDNAASWDVGVSPSLNPLVLDTVSIASGIAGIGNVQVNINSLLVISGSGGVSKSETSHSDSINAGGLLDLQSGTTRWGEQRFYIKGTTSSGSGELKISGGINTFTSLQYFSVGRESDGVGLLTISGGDTVISSGTATIFGGYKGAGQVEMTGGTLTSKAPKKWRCSSPSSPNGTNAAA